MQPPATLLFCLSEDFPRQRYYPRRVNNSWFGFEQVINLPLSVSSPGELSVDRRFAGEGYSVPKTCNHGLTARSWTNGVGDEMWLAGGSRTVHFTRPAIDRQKRLERSCAVPVIVPACPEGFLFFFLPSFQWLEKIMRPGNYLFFFFFFF